MAGTLAKYINSPISLVHYPKKIEGTLVAGKLVKTMSKKREKYRDCGTSFSRNKYKATGLTNRLRGYIISVNRKKIGLNEMKYNELLKFTVDSKVQIFSIEDLMKLFPNEKEESIARLVYNWLGSKKIIRLKRGIYQISYPEKKIIPDMYVANRLYSPSYVSMETILSMCGIIPEIAMSVTSVTTKATRRFKNSYGAFSYRTVKKEYFTGYYLLKERGFENFVAEPEKAVIDFLYLNNLSKIDRADAGSMRKLSKKSLKKYADLMEVNIGGLYVDL